MPFEPTFSITPKTATSLMRIEAARQAVQDLPITACCACDPSEKRRGPRRSPENRPTEVSAKPANGLDPEHRYLYPAERCQATVFLERLVSRRKSSNLLPKWVRLHSTHYSTMIEGNRLTQEQVCRVIEHQHFPGRERDEKEVPGYYAALEKAEQIAASGAPVSETHIQTLHGLVMAEGRRKAKPTRYRDGQNVIRDSRTRSIAYMPPKAKDVPRLMKALAAWISTSQRDSLPCPIRAGIAHYQFATVHPYYDGNGRTARLLITLLQLGGY